MKKGALILSQSFHRFLSADFVIAADAGYLRAKENGISPDLLVGDLDSLGRAPADLPLIKVASEKDFSDGELGVRQAALRNIDALDIYGAIGGRPDHFLYNLHLLKIAADLGLRAVIRGDESDIYYTESTLLLDTEIGDTLSVVPLGESVHIIKATGLKYPAEGAILTVKDTLGLSNECREKMVFLAVEKGGALVVHTFR